MIDITIAYLAGLIMGAGIVVVVYAAARKSGITDLIPVGKPGGWKRAAARALQKSADADELKRKAMIFQNKPEK